MPDSGDVRIHDLDRRRDAERARAAPGGRLAAPLDRSDGFQGDCQAAMRRDRRHRRHHGLPCRISLVLPRQSAIPDCSDPFSGGRDYELDSQRRSAYGTGNDWPHKSEDRDTIFSYDRWMGFPQSSGDRDGCIEPQYRPSSARSRSTPRPQASERNSSADMYLLPMLVTLAAGMLTRPFGASLDILYPVTVIATASVLFVYRGKIVRLGWSPDWIALGAGRRGVCDLDCDRAMVRDAARFRDGDMRCTGRSGLGAIRLVRSSGWRVRL